VWGPIDQAALEWCWERGEAAGRGTTAVASAEWRLEPLRTSLGTLAVVAFARPDGRDPIRADRGVLFNTLVSQAALAHERLILEDRLRLG
jgi:two-component system sensor histidine kinase KdpD